MKSTFLVVAASALVLFACTGGSTETGDGGTEDGGDAGSRADATFGCTPGSSVFCRCSDRSEGTKLCQPDGQSFGMCSPCP